MSESLPDLLLLIRRTLHHDATRVSWEYMEHALEALAALENKRQIFVALARAAVANTEVAARLSLQQIKSLEKLFKPKKASAMRMKYFMVTIGWMRQHLLHMLSSPCTTAHLTRLLRGYFGDATHFTGADILSTQPHRLHSEELFDLDGYAARFAILTEDTAGWRAAGRPHDTKPDILREEADVISASTIFKVTEDWLQHIELMASLWRNVETSCRHLETNVSTQRAQKNPFGSMPRHFQSKGPLEAQSTRRRAGHLPAASHGHATARDGEEPGPPVSVALPIATSSRIRVEDLEVLAARNPEGMVTRKAADHPPGVKRRRLGSAGVMDACDLPHEHQATVAGVRAPTPHASGPDVPHVSAASEASSIPTASQNASQKESFATTDTTSTSPRKLQGPLTVVIEAQVMVVPPDGDADNGMASRVHVLAPSSQETLDKAINDAVQRQLAKQAESVDAASKAAPTPTDLVALSRKRKKDDDVVLEKPTESIFERIVRGARSFLQPSQGWREDPSVVLTQVEMPTTASIAPLPALVEDDDIRSPTPARPKTPSAVELPAIDKDLLRSKARPPDADDKNAIINERIRHDIERYDLALGRLYMSGNLTSPTPPALASSEEDTPVQSQSWERRPVESQIEPNMPPPLESGLHDLESFVDAHRQLPLPQTMATDDMSLDLLMTPSYDAIAFPPAAQSDPHRTGFSTSSGEPLPPAGQDSNAITSSFEHDVSNVSTQMSRDGTHSPQPESVGPFAYSPSHPASDMMASELRSEAVLPLSDLEAQALSHVQSSTSVGSSVKDIEAAEADIRDFFDAEAQY